VSDAVIVALITTAGSIFVAVLTMWNSNKAVNSDTETRLKKENEALKRENNEKQEIIDYYRKRDK
jgi:heme-degrading monooxygenase HmoA